MSEMVERVARVISWKAHVVSKEQALEAARAVIEAMREPTDEMIGAGSWQAVAMDGPHKTVGDGVRASYRAMIAAALAS